MLRRALLTLMTLTLFALTAAAPQAQTAFAPVALVNDTVITHYDLEQRMRLLVVNGAPQGPQLRSIALEQLVVDRVRLDAAKRAGVTPARSAIDAAVEDYAKRRNTTVAGLEQQLARAGVARKTLEDGLAAELGWVETVRRRFGARAEPTDPEIDQEMALTAAGQTRSFRIGEIVLPFAGRGEARTRALADELSATLARGGDFAQAARRNSASPSAAQGGDVGWVPESGLPPAIVEALGALSEGGVTAPIPITGGLAVLKLIETRSEAANAIGAATVEVMSVQGVGRAAQGQVAALAAQAPGCETAPALAQAAGLRVQKSEPTDLAALPPQVRNAVSALEVGEISAPVRTQDGAVAFILCARVSGASAEAREALRGRMRSQRLQGFAASYLQELRAEAVVELR